MITEPSTEATPASLTYEPYYGLREKPFSLSSDPRFLYTGPSHVRAFEQLLAGIKRREGVIVLSGEIGTGKTTLCRGVLEALDRRTFSTFVRDPFLSREDLLKTLLIDFGVMSIDDLKKGRLNGASRPDLSYPLYEFLDSLVPLQAFAVLIIDEAQNLSHSLLEEIRILSELEAREKLLQVVLVGQPELRANLKLPQLRQVDQRVSVRCELGSLPAGEVAQYIAHRLGVASVGAPAVEFTPEAARLVARASGGVPRVINLVCDRALHRGFVARAANIDAATVFGAVEDLGRAVEADQPPAIVSVEHSPVRPAAASGDGAQSTKPASAGPVVPADAPKEPKEGAVRAAVTAPPLTVIVVPAEKSTSPQMKTAPQETPAAPVARPDAPALETARDGADPLAEFSQEADLVPRAAGRGKSKVFAAAAILMVSVAAGVWLARPRQEAAGASSAQPTALASPAIAADVSGEPVPAPVHAPLPATEAVPAAADDPADLLDAAVPVEAAGPTYAIQVASFQSRVRAQRALDELSAAGYQAEGIEVDLGPRGIWIQLLVGRYPSLGQAEADLAIVRERASYADARVVALSE